MGSAVGLGNIWRFPWMTAQNGGSAFLVTYLFIVIGVGVPGLLATLVIGRRSNRNPVGAFKALKGSRGWVLLGGICVLTSVVLISFYSVVGGWILRYFIESFTGAYFANPGAHFEAVNYGIGAFQYQVLFLIITALIVMVGVREGIETTTKIMMPGVAILLSVMAIWAFRQPNAAQGYQFYLSFDGQYLSKNFLSVVSSAAGQALFTLSIGGGTMLTYASYIEEDRSLPFDASTIAILNLGIGVLAGLVVFPLLFSYADGPTGGGPGALFVSIAGAFANLPAGELLGATFFLVVLLAAITSSISMLEIPVSFLVDEFGLKRSRVTRGLFVIVVATGAPNAFNAAVFSFVAGHLVSLLMTLGLIGFMFYAAWVLGPDAVEEYLKGAGSLSRPFAGVWRYAIGSVFPVFLLFSFYTDSLSLAGYSVDSMEVLAVTLLTAIPFVVLVHWSERETPSKTTQSMD
ncbi:sodium-dependent transporter [Haloferax mediterranei ATCC 33500]|uniref:Sodium-dependent transporter n=1 Tax=Haloferax mediterranei (strain ATCC 33500 / DSM 1411 / JCM 8866 / NBRC 14739 / NCIMB 2177 / R-4) TaxID=523841 RepID=M0INV4_HALMT|nr:sodium-dependent transporter [Haloferax mediterranei ATCC 33500]